MEGERKRHPSFSTHSDVLRVLREQRVPILVGYVLRIHPHRDSLSSTLPLGSFPLGVVLSHHSTLPPPFHDLGTSRDRRRAAPASKLTSETSLERGGQQRSRRLAPLCGRKRAPLVGRRGVVNARVRVAGCIPLSSWYRYPLPSCYPRSSSAPTVTARVPFCSSWATRESFHLCRIRYVAILSVGKSNVYTVGRIDRIQRVGDRRLRRRQHALRALSTLRIYRLCEYRQIRWCVCYFFLTQ